MEPGFDTVIVSDHQDFSVCSGIRKFLHKTTAERIGAAVPRVRIAVQEKPVYIEVPTKVEKLSLQLNEVLLKKEIDRNTRIRKALEGES